MKVVVPSDGGRAPALRRGGKRVSRWGGRGSCYRTHMALVTAICRAVIDGESKNLGDPKRGSGGGGSGRVKEKESEETVCVVVVVRRRDPPSPPCHFYRNLFIPCSVGLMNDTCSLPPLSPF